MQPTPFEILKLKPTDNKLTIRKAYVREAKLHHPDHGGDPGHFKLVQEAYEKLIQKRSDLDIIVVDVKLPLSDFLYGCIATVEMLHGPLSGNTIEFIVPPFTTPGSSLEFNDTCSTSYRIRVKLFETIENSYTRLNSSIVVRRQINISEATSGISLQISNFDGFLHTVTIPPKTTANQLIYNISGAGFFERDSRIRGNLTIIVEVNKKGN